MAKGAKEENANLLPGKDCRVVPTQVSVYGATEGGAAAPSFAGVAKPADSPLSFLVICLVICTGDTARGILFPTLYGRVTAMGGNKTTQGLMVAAFSAGRVFSSPYMGRWSEHHGMKNILSVAALIIVVGGLLNAFARSNPVLVLAQAVTGVGSGTLGVTRAYVSERTFGAERTFKTARLTAVQYVGFTVTPVVGSALKRGLGETEAAYLGGLVVVNAATAAAYVLVALALLGLLCLHTIFVDYVPAQDRAYYQSLDPRNHHHHTAATAAEEGGGGEGQPPVEAFPSPSSAAAASSSSSSSSAPSLRPGREDMDLRAVHAWTEVDWCILGGLALNVATKGSIGVYETVGVPVAEQLFGIGASGAGELVSACGACGAAILLFAMKPLALRFHDTQLMVFGVAIMVVSTWLLVPSDHRDTNHPVFLWLSIAAMYATGYPIGHTAVLTWFGKLSKQSAQGFLQGWFASFGSVGRILLPAVSGLVAEVWGFQVLFRALGVWLVLTWLCIAYNYQRFTRLTT